MALKKSELYSSLWSSCDELRGGMDASQYKDYVLVLLFVKYVSDKYAGQPYAPITIPEGASFADMVALKGKSDIGDQINKKILGPLAQANSLSDMPDFNDPAKLGSGKEMVERLTNLIAIFENPSLDFSKNRTDGDDLFGDAYEYLMRHFATESGKSKGQFYTPAEVSRVIAQILGIRYANTSNETTVYDPTCGSGSLLLKIGDEARHGKDVKVTLYGQEKDNATAGLARMNMILHDYATAEVKQGNTLASPLFTDGDALKTFDYVVANPPFSDKRWSTGLDAEHDPWQRFLHYGIPPAKQGDYAYLLHILRSIKPAGKGACILPHGVLFRGNVEATIRRNLIRRGYIKGIIGLPPNLFYGTGIPACIIVLDKEGANARKGIFVIDASRGFIKDGPKNRLRELQRDLRLAISDYAPESQVVANGKVWTSYALKRPPKREWRKFKYAVCASCSCYQRVDAASDQLLKQCQNCEQPLKGKRVKGTFVIPEFGFVASYKEPGKPSESRPTKTYATQVYYTNDYARQEKVISVQFGGIILQAKGVIDGQLAVLNRAGFKICFRCGYAERMRSSARSTSSKLHRTAQGRECLGANEIYIIRAG